MDPCEPRTIGNGMPKSDGLLLYEIPLEVEHLFNGAPTTPMYTTHVAARGTYLPGTVRCTSGHRHRYPAYSGSGTLVDALVIYCFADVRVNAYLLGSGPSTLTVIVRSSLYALKGDDEDYGLEQLESRRVAYERALAEGGQFGYEEPLEGYLLPGGDSGPVRLEYSRQGPVVIGPIGGIGGKEAVLFIGPSYSLSVEAWRVLWTWDMERQEDDTVVVLHPFRQWLTTEEYSSVGEMELPAITQAVTAAHQERVATNGGRIGADTDLPMLQTDTNQLRQYFSDPKVGGYAPGTPTPAQPPPPCGLAVPNQGSNPGLMRDCMTLLASKDTLRGTGALNWDVGTTITSWDGVTVEGAPQRVARLKLTNKSLTGSIPERLADLDALVELKLSGNTLTGCIPLSLKDVATNDPSSLNLLYCQPPAPTPTPKLRYLEEEIPPCTPINGSSVDPCEPREEWASTAGSDGLLIFDVPLTVESFVNIPIDFYTTHVALRGTYIPGTVRCTSGHRTRWPSYSGGESGGLSIYCFADVRVNAYLLGSGPSTLTVIVESSLYQTDITNSGVDDEDYGLEQLESRRVAYERALAEGGQFAYEEPLQGYLLPGGGIGQLHLDYRREGPVVIGSIGGIGGKEAVLFIGPSNSLSVEAWRVFDTWEVERQEDDTVVVLHPYRRWLTYEEYSSVGEMELPTFAQAVTAAHQGRVATNGGRIGSDTDLPMLQTDANQLRQYFSDPKVGGYAPGTPTPAQPPPPCGLAVPNQGSNPGLMRDCMTLLASKDTLRGTGALNWDVGTTITSWNGVTVEGAPQRIARLKLTNKSLTGSIPERLADLDALVELKLSGNTLTGCIPLSLKDVATNDPVR